MYTVYIYYIYMHIYIYYSIYHIHIRKVLLYNSPSSDPLLSLLHPFQGPAPAFSKASVPVSMLFDENWDDKEPRIHGKFFRKTHPVPWEPKTFIFRGYNPYIGGVKPSFFMVLGSHGSKLVGGWTNPSEKICSWNWIISPIIGMNI